VRALFLDLDGAPLEPVLLHATPHIITESSPGRFHPYYRVQEMSNFTSSRPHRKS
jgi:hypothetical protein